MTDQALVFLIVLAGMSYWLPGFFYRLKRPRLQWTATAVPAAGLVTVLAAGGGIGAALGLGLYLAGLYALGYALTGLGRRGPVWLAPEALLAGAGLPMFGGVLVFGGQGIWLKGLLLISPPVAVADVCGYNVFRGILYGVTPLSEQFLVIPPWWASLLTIGTAAAVLGGLAVVGKPSSGRVDDGTGHGS